MTRKIVATIRLIRPTFGATHRDKTLLEKHETFMRSMVANPAPPAGNPHRLPIVRRGRKTIAAYTGMQLAVGDFIYSGHTFEVCVCSGATRLNLLPGEWAGVYGVGCVERRENPYASGFHQTLDTDHMGGAIEASGIEYGY
jgi:hypothetical protein